MNPDNLQVWQRDIMEEFFKDFTIGENIQRWVLALQEGIMSQFKLQSDNPAALQAGWPQDKLPDNPIKLWQIFEERFIEAVQEGDWRDDTVVSQLLPMMRSGGLTTSLLSLLTMPAPNLTSAKLSISHNIQTDKGIQLGKPTEFDKTFWGN